MDFRDLIPRVCIYCLRNFGDVIDDLFVHGYSICNMSKNRASCFIKGSEHRETDESTMPKVIVMVTLFIHGKSDLQNNCK